MLLCDRLMYCMYNMFVVCVLYVYHSMLLIYCIYNSYNWCSCMYSTDNMDNIAYYIVINIIMWITLF